MRHQFDTLLKNKRGNGIVASVVGLAMAGALAGALAQTFSGAAKWTQKIASGGELEDIKNNYFRIPRFNCEQSLYKIGSTELIDACTSNPGGFLKFYVGNRHQVIDIPTADAVGGYTKISKYEMRASCPQQQNKPRQLVIEYREVKNEIPTDWKYLFPENTICSYIFNGSTSTNMCPPGQFVIGTDSSGKVKCQEAISPSDFDGDGIGDYVVGTGAGVIPTITVFSGKDNSIIATMQPYSNYTGGVSVGMILGNGINTYAKIVAIPGPGPGGGPHMVTYAFDPQTRAAHQVASIWGDDASRRIGWTIGP